MDRRHRQCRTTPPLPCLLISLNSPPLPLPDARRRSGVGTVPLLKTTLICMLTFHIPHPAFIIPHMSPTFTLIIVTHNSARWLPAFFKTWHDAVTTLPHEILIADSGSSDNTRELVSSLAPSAKILDCGNIGFGAAANRATALSAAPWLLMCNPDLTFPANFESDFLAPLTTHPPAGTGCIVPTLRNEDHSLQHSVGKFPTLSGMIRDQFRPRGTKVSPESPEQHV